MDRDLGRDQPDQFEPLRAASFEGGPSRRRFLGSGLAAAIAAGLSSRLVAAGEPEHDVPDKEGELREMDQFIEEGIETGMDAMLDRWMAAFSEAESGLIEGMRHDMRVALGEIYAEYHADFRYRIIQFHFRDNPLFKGGTMAEYRQQGFELMEQIREENAVLIEIFNNVLGDPGHMFFGVEPQSTLKDRLDRIRRMPPKSQVEPLSELADELSQLIMVGPDGSSASGDEQPGLVSDLLYVQALLDQTIKDQAGQVDKAPAVNPGPRKVDPNEEDMHGGVILLEDRVPAITLDPNAFRNPGALLGSAQQDLWAVVARLLLAQSIYARIHDPEKLLLCEVPLNPPERVPMMQILSIDQKVRLGLNDGQGFRSGFAEWLQTALPGYVNHAFREGMGEEPNAGIREKLTSFYNMHPLVSFAGEVMADTDTDKPRWYKPEPSSEIFEGRSFDLAELKDMWAFIYRLQADNYCPPDMRKDRTVDTPYSYGGRERKEYRCVEGGYYSRRWSTQEGWLYLPSEDEVRNWRADLGSSGSIWRGYHLISSYQDDPEKMLQLMDAIYLLRHAGALNYYVQNAPRMAQAVVESGSTVARGLMPYTRRESEVPRRKLERSLGAEEPFTQFVGSCPTEGRRCDVTELWLGDERPVSLEEVLHRYANLPWRTALGPLAAAASSLATPAR